MRKTANYQLNQWDPGDRILREDFNGDNKKIDNAIFTAYNRSLWRPLRSIVTEADAEQVEVDIEGFDWGDWIYVHLSVEVYTSEDRAAVLVRANGTDVLEAWGNVPGSATGYLGHATLFTLGDKRRNILSLASNGYTGVGFRESSYKFNTSYLHPFTVVGKGRVDILAGTRIQIWGVQ